MAAGTKFRQFVEDLAEKVHNLGADALKVMLVNSPAPVNTNSVKGDLTEISAGNGYTAGGTAVTITTSAQSAGTYTLAGNQVVFTATGAMATFRYPVLYNDTPTSPADPLIGFWDYGSGLSLALDETFTVKFNNANPGTILTIAQWLLAAMVPAQLVLQDLANLFRRVFTRGERVSKGPAALLPGQGEPRALSASA
jgi:hypothetical protein